jgi:hypothetical protein
MGTEVMGTVCPEGLIVWDQMSGEHMRLGSNVSQPSIDRSGEQLLKIPIFFEYFRFLKRHAV